MRKRSLAEIEYDPLSLLHAYGWEVGTVLTNFDISKSDSKETIVAPEHYFTGLEVNQSTYDVSYGPFFSI